MAKRVFIAAVAAALVAAAPAFAAQRASLADRVSALEQASANSGQGNVELLNQIAALRAEVQSLRGDMEQLQQQLEQERESNKNLYLDVDGRLQRLEGGASATPPSATAKTPAVPAPVDRPPSVHGDRGALAATGDERSAYQAAFDTLKSGQYVDSARQFQAFLAQYPDGTYAPNALYWLGESYYVTQNYELAQQQFQALLQRYPTHDKASAALLKLGLSQYGAKQYDAAEATLTAVQQQYPGSDAAATAADRLQAIRLARAR
ncbi:tol-pal system protein YbgF [Pseudoluteimonas lycopersici]|uniref:Cell division coordinator CpoB n=1 Tax=Pseudoluteimonas lycopersici TaxID=1324796 RepID=A0A516V7Q0_9GAMM|nr:tol-pal system protein YbgF [Lysobacter lycopersici]QDQ74558.1 tol-pal system protein YbgF [Lysobacter lycopersici]